MDGRFTWQNTSSDTRFQQNSKDQNTYYRTQLDDAGTANVITNGQFAINSPTIISLQSGGGETLRLNENGDGKFLNDLNVEGTATINNLNVEGATTTKALTASGNIISTGSITAGIMGTVGTGTNVVCNADGTLQRSSVTYMSKEEVTEQLAIQDKIIEALEARLTKLEARNK